ncbi:hypothetical protein BKA67DRAFT_311911 [Truncatella angustata]|uniref:Zn(2)-C6 fungal-type domain-containing protein n=1 Tax=Truncatella angustata TaxID=152316 RepID=A0A9P8UJG5_9PEZI|nr:uncharacterized protein BKA67DRAFT_311911 [Truncatella angustata]KAH6653226.1 hypothetical protein BKA67DRAFT_311911 [Truncatella angustata]
MDQPEGTRVHRRRTEYGKRSKQGCRTCITKKVKCDEQHPRCKRCIRLDLHCEWTEQVPSLTLRRRGWGPIKARDSWTPKSITPKPAACGSKKLEECDADILSDSPNDLQDTVMYEEDRKTRSASPNTDRLLKRTRAQDLREMRVEKEPWLMEADDDALASNLSVDRSTHANMDSDLPLTGHQEPDNHKRSIMTVPLLSDALLQSNLLTVATSMLFAGVPSVMVSGSDYQAVEFHRVIFAPLKSTRSAAVSAHSIFLDRALSNTMALHFLLAVSHSELAIHRGHGMQTPPESWLHFNRGSQLLFDAGNVVSQSDHVGVLLSFLYMYMFWMRRDPFNNSMLRELSRAVLLHVETYALDDLCANADLGEPEASSWTDKVLLSRILTYLYDRDGFCCFFGCGGAFAGYVNVHHEKRARMWRLSQTGFSASARNNSTAMSSGQPTISQNAKVTDVYFQLIAIHHDINRYSQNMEAQDMGQETRIKHELQRMELEQRWLVEMVEDCRAQTTPPSLMALVTVTFYYALQIYFHRSRNSAFGELPIPAKVQIALSQLVATAYYTVATGPVQLLERFQWALLIAGTETRDPIHREWISRTIADPGMKSALQLILDAKKSYCISMRAIRQLVSGVSHPS